MLKIGPKIQKSIYRYEMKNTISGRYERYINRAYLFGIGTGVQMARFSNWGFQDIGITSILATLSLKNFKEAFKMQRALKPIKQRALSIKKAALK
ncbi:hypothetical protein IJ541_11100 [bacterium]|nr:hypothetical protein [bacterium]